MITDFGLSILFYILEQVFSMIPDVTWTIDTGAFSYFLDTVQVVCYFFPMTTVGQIIGITLSLMGFRIVISLAKIIVEFIPMF